MKKFIILLFLVVTTGVAIFGQEEKTYVLEIEGETIVSSNTNVIPEKVQKNFFLIYDSINIRQTVDWNELVIREPNPISKDLEKAQETFLKAYNCYKKKNIVIHEDARVQKTFDDNVDIIYNIITNNLLQYGGNNTEWLIFYLEDFAFVLQGKADSKDENFIRDCYWVYCNTDVALLEFFNSY